MKRLAIALLFLLPPAAVRAADATDAPVQLPEFFVPGDRVGALELVVPRGDLRPPEPNLGQELLAIPGVYSHARAADAMEPNIRGLSFDRVATTINGLPLVNASPERTNSPVVILGPAAVNGVLVTKALPSVTLGPATTGGRIALDTDRPRADATAAPTAGFVSVMYNDGRDGYTARGRFDAAAGAWDATATFFRNDLGDYTAADGRVVAARFDDYGASAALGWHDGTHRLRAEILQRRLVEQETVSLPLDGKNTESDVLTLNDRFSFDSGLLEAVEWRAGYAYTDPYITSEDRKAPSLTFAQAAARSAGGGVNTLWRDGQEGTIAIGGDYAWQDRKAVRTTAAGQDYIWPDVFYADSGVFGEWHLPLGSSWKLRLGGRIDEVRSDARDADRLALGRPLRDQFVTYDGPTAATTARHDVVGAANLLLEWKRNSTVSAFIGTGISAQPAGVMERYRAFLNALGGDGHGGNAVELGNPTLGSERKAALEAGGTVHRAWSDLEATVYYYRVDGFILRTPIGFTPAPAHLVVFGYRNIPAEFAGTELAATLKPANAWRIPLTLAVTDGRNRTTGVGLSEIPPWEATAAVRYHPAQAKVPFAAEIGTRIVGAKSNPAPLDNPLFGSTGGFAVWHARIGVPLGAHCRIEIGGENLLDHRYSEYLTPPVAPFAPASGNLKPGDRVPAPGRSAWASWTLQW